jgi:hypothetical protein
VVLGTHVEVELIDEFGDGERLAFDIVPDSAADFANGFLGIGTPLAQALLGQAAGRTMPYRMGDIVEVRLLNVAPSRRTAAGDAAARRQAIAQEALSKANLDEFVQLALTFSSKWGDYDPEGLADNWDK